MDLKQLDAVNINDKEEVKQLQRYLQSRGLLPQGKGEIDGVWGGDTTKAAQQLRKELVDNLNTNLEISRNKIIESDPKRNAIRGATEIGPYAVGAGIGALGGHLGAKGFNAWWDRDAAETKKLAGNPKISGQAGLAQMRGARTARRLGIGGQFIGPAALLGSAEYIREHVAPGYDDPETRKWINLGANAERGAGLGLLAHQLYDLKNRWRTPASLEDEGLIETRAAAERAAPPPQNALDAAGRPPAPAPSFKSGAEARRYAAEQGVKLPTKLTAAEAIERAEQLKAATDIAQKGSRVARIASKAGKLGLPAVAGIAAYELAGEPAEAADGSMVVPSTANRLAVAGGGVGLYAGMNRLAQALPQAVNTAFSAVGRMQPLMAIDEMTNLVPISDAENARAQGAENQTLNMLARHLPRALQPGPVRRAGEMAQVPPRNPMFHDVGDQPNALAAAGAEPDAFGEALASFMSLLRDGGFGEQEVMR